MKEKIEKQNVETMLEDSKNVTEGNKLQQLIQEGYHEYKTQSIKNHEIILKTLSAEERASAYSLAGFDSEFETINEETASEDELRSYVKKIKDQYETNKLALLSYSIVSIDGEKLDLPKEEIYKELARMNADFTDVLYLEYQKMQNEYFNSIANLENFKKKLSTDQKTSSPGQSVES